MFVDKMYQINFVYPVIPSEFDSTQFSAVDIVIDRERIEFEVTGCFFYCYKITVDIHGMTFKKT